MLSAQEIGLILVGFLLAGVVFAIVAIVRERRRARDPSLQHPVCRRCGYRLNDTTSKACSECGAALGARGAIVAAWYHRVHMRRLRIWCAGAPGLLAMVLLAMTMIGIPGTPAVPGTPMQAYLFLSWPASSPLASVAVFVGSGRDTAYQTRDLLPGGVREVTMRVFQRGSGDVKQVLERELTLASDPQSPAFFPGEDGVVRDEAGVPLPGSGIGVPVFARDLPGVEVAQWLLPPDSCAVIAAIEAGGGAEQGHLRDECAALYALIADFLDDPLYGVTPPSLLPPGVTAQRTTGWVGGTPATPMQPFYRRWMLPCAVGIYLVGAVLAGISARRVWSWPEVSREK